MSALTLTELYQELAAVNAAIQSILNGKRVTELRIGEDNFLRGYKYSDVTLDNLRSYREDLLNNISALEPDVRPVFRSNATIPLVVSK
jgi:hypothetical protein